MTNRKYKITIHTSRTQGVHEEMVGVLYPRKPKRYVGDTINIFTQKIEIIAERNGKFNLKDVTEYKQNTLYLQVYKALLYLFLKIGKRIKIKSIDIACGKYSETLNVDAKRQPLLGKIDLKFLIPSNVLDVVWQDEVKGKTFRAATSHFLIALSSNDRYKKFDRLWRAFEQVAVWHKYHNDLPNKPKEFEVLVEMRKYFCSIQQKLQHTFDFVDTLDTAKIETLHWRRLIENNYSSNDKTKQVDCLYHDLVEKNSDWRLVVIFKKAVDIFKKDIDSKGKTADFESLINSYTATQKRNNAHVLSLIVCKYCYFMRNKIFHGEMDDMYFCFTNHTEDDDITDFLNELLTILVNELICEYDKL